MPIVAASIGVTKRFGAVTAVDHVSLGIARGAFYSLLGPTGCGKTTTLRMIAGFEQPTEGEILIAGEPVAGVPPYRRNVNTVFQHYALVPAHGRGAQRRLRAAPGGRVEGRTSAARSARPSSSSACPATTSGGRGSSRAASSSASPSPGRSSTGPTVLLLDEPLGALDLKLRKEMQLELKSLQQEVGITFVYVTHDQEEAMTMSDVIVVMRDGRIQQQGSPEELYERPVNRFVAGFIGQSNSIAGRLVALDPATGPRPVETAAGARLHGRLTDPAAEPAIGDAVVIAVRPERLDAGRRRRGPDGRAGRRSSAASARRPTSATRPNTASTRTSGSSSRDGRTTVGRDTGSVGPGEPVTVRWPDDANLVLVA